MMDQPEGIELAYCVKCEKQAALIVDEIQLGGFFSRLFSKSTEPPSCAHYAICTECDDQRVRKCPGDIE